MKTEDCPYCEKFKTLDALMVPVCDLPASRVYLWKDGRYPGRCLVALNKHFCEMFELDVSLYRQFMTDVSAVALAIRQSFQADKINYAIYGDTVPHLHFHLVPKREGGMEWGRPFEVNPSPLTLMSPQEIQRCVLELQTSLKLLPELAEPTG